MVKLVDLSGWKDRIAERGKGVGNIISEKYYLCYDPHNWIISKQIGESGKMLGESYYPNFKLLLPVVEKLLSDHLSFDKTVSKIIDELGFTLDIYPEIDTKVGPEDIGKQIDKEFKTSFFIGPDLIYEKLTKSQIAEENIESDSGIEAPEHREEQAPFVHSE